MPILTSQNIIRPFLLYGGLTFTIIRRAVLVGMALLFIHVFIVTVVPVKGLSMDPTLKDGTYLLVDQLTPRIAKLSRGQIIAFRYPLDMTQKFIKRIIGEPGDTMTVTNKQVFLEPAGQTQLLLREPYLPFGRETEGELEEFIESGGYFAMGDNRPESYDSRYFGAVPQELILGRAWLAIWPFSEFRLISHFDPLQSSK